MHTNTRTKYTQGQTGWYGEGVVTGYFTGQNRTKWFHQGQAKIKKYKLNQNQGPNYLHLNVHSYQGSSPYILPSKGEIVPPISIMINENNEIILSPQHRIVNHGSRILIESLSIRVLVMYIMFIVITRHIQKWQTASMRIHKKTDDTCNEEVFDGSTRVHSFRLILEGTHWDHKINTG